MVRAMFDADWILVDHVRVGCLTEVYKKNLKGKAEQADIPFQPVIDKDPVQGPFQQLTAKPPAVAMQRVPPVAQQRGACTPHKANRKQLPPLPSVSLPSFPPSMELEDISSDEDSTTASLQSSTTLESTSGPSELSDSSEYSRGSWWDSDPDLDSEYERRVRDGRGHNNWHTRYCPVYKKRLTGLFPDVTCSHRTPLTSCNGLNAHIKGRHGQEVWEADQARKKPIVAAKRGATRRRTNRKKAWKALQQRTAAAQEEVRRSLQPRRISLRLPSRPPQDTREDSPPPRRITLRLPSPARSVHDAREPSEPLRRITLRHPSPFADHDALDEATSVSPPDGPGLSQPTGPVSESVPPREVDDASRAVPPREDDASRAVPLDGPGLSQPTGSSRESVPPVDDASLAVPLDAPGPSQPTGPVSESVPLPAQDRTATAARTFLRHCQQHVHPQYRRIAVPRAAHLVLGEIQPGGLLPTDSALLGITIDKKLAQTVSGLLRHVGYVFRGRRLKLRRRDKRLNGTSHKQEVEAWRSTVPKYTAGWHKSFNEICTNAWECIETFGWGILASEVLVGYPGGDVYRQMTKAARNAALAQLDGVENLVTTPYNRGMEQFVRQHFEE
jgi:hypothetical protein